MRRALLSGIAVAVLAGPAIAQRGPIGGVVGGVGGTAGDIVGSVRGVAGQLDQVVTGAADIASRLASARIERLTSFVRSNRDVVELDASGNPSRKGELLLLDPKPDEIAAARDAGFATLGEERLSELGITVLRLGTPERLGLRKAQALLAEKLPDARIASDALLFQSGGSASPVVTGSSRPGGGSIETRIGVIDGAPGSFAGVAQQKGFATGAPVGSNHGSAVVSLLQLAGATRIAVADVYGTDRAGGNTLAVVRALDWLLGTGARVVSISLVGPSSPLLAKAIDTARRRGATIVSAVGNDGPAAPPAWPASFPGVLAVTAVDGRNRPLIEAGRALHLDYAAPGADMLAADMRGRWVRVRGTSFAVPFVAARAAAAIDRREPVISTLDGEAQRPATVGPAKLGRGVLCGGCRRTR